MGELDDAQHLSRMHIAALKKRLAGKDTVGRTATHR
jgi:hypothetical protein